MAKVLLLEDDRDLAGKVSDFLSANNHIVEAVDTGTEALDRLKLYGYDALILDWNVPGMTGEEVCRKYRGNGGTVPVLMVTGRHEVADVEAGFAAGADDYLRKPFSPQELLCRLLAVLRRQPKRQDQVSLVENITFHHSSRELYVGNKEVALQPQESAILDYLLKNRQWITPQNLALRIGEATTTVEAIRTSVMTLRKKIAANGGAPIIISSRGEGYMVASNDDGRAKS